VRAAGLARDQVYVTNAVKHFSFEERGKRRLHKKPSSRQVSACRPWLEAEIQQVKPKGVICLGATAAQALLGRDFRLTKRRGEFLDTDWAEWIMATYHPSALLRAPDEAAREQLRRLFFADLRNAAGRLRAAALRRV
jgi:uracil-DNA glycosylase